MLQRLWTPPLRRMLVGRWRRLRLRAGDPPLPSRRLQRPGLYLHIPFCRSLCPFCPYNRVRYDERLYAQFERAAHEEIDLYTAHLDGSDIQSLYVGGGTPTVDMSGLSRLLDHLRGSFNIRGGICIELHPANMDGQSLQRLREMGVTQVSIGVQSTSDRLLAKLGRSHGGQIGLDAARNAVQCGFEAVNADLLFSLPTQTLGEWETDVKRVLETGVDQISTYPLFTFPYSDDGLSRRLATVRQSPGRLVRRMLNRADDLAREHGLKRCAVWSWVRPGRRKFSSVTRHHYVGIGPSAGSMIGSHFYVNTFNVQAYADALPQRRPVALSMPVDRRLEMVYWLYWRLYELRAAQGDFEDLFGAGASLIGEFGRVLWPFCRLGWLERDDGEYRVTHAGAYWIHRLQNAYSLGYIDGLWGTCRREAWPAEVGLH